MERRRLLLVEDHRDTAEAMAAVLRLWGYEVLTAASSQEAVEAAKSAVRAGGGIDAVVCDIGLPDGNGWDLMRLLSARFHLRGLAVTAFSSFEDRERSAEAGFAAHLVKPVDLGALARTLERVTGGGSGTRPADDAGQENPQT